MAIVPIKNTDEWSPELARLVGLISIAFSQLLREVYLAAKRKADKPLADWENADRDDRFSKWCNHLISKYPQDRELAKLIERARCAGHQRDDLIHATWGRHRDGHLGRWRRGRDLGIDLAPLQDLLLTIRELRDDINLHTRGKTPAGDKGKPPPERG